MVISTDSAGRAGKAAGPGKGYAPQDGTGANKRQGQTTRIGRPKVTLERYAALRPVRYLRPTLW